MKLIPLTSKRKSVVDSDDFEVIWCNADFIRAVVQKGDYSVVSFDSEFQPSMRVIETPEQIIKLVKEDTNGS